MSSTIFGNWRIASSPAVIDLEAQTIAGRHAPFTLPSVAGRAIAAAAPTRTLQVSATDAIDDFFGVTRPRATRESRHDSRPSLGGGDMPPPPYADPELPAYSFDLNTEPITLARSFFKFGFLFPPFWIFGTIILLSPLTVPADFEPSKSRTERQEMVQIIRDAELRWAKRCGWALLGLLVLGGVAITGGLLCS